jgi:hypothetical protein
MLTQWATDDILVCSALRNLAGNSMIRDIVEPTFAAGQQYDDRRVMEAYLHACGSFKLLAAFSVHSCHVNIRR